MYGYPGYQWKVVPPCLLNIDVRALLDIETGAVDRGRDLC